MAKITVLDSEITTSRFNENDFKPIKFDGFGRNIKLN